MKLGANHPPFKAVASNVALPLHASTGQRRGSLEGLQYLRAIAALMVVWTHAREQFDWLRLQFPSEAGAYGVDLFFVISGFVMVYTTHGRQITAWQFMRKRIERVAPLYWVTTLGLLAVALLAPSLVRSVMPDLGHTVASLLFWPMVSPKFPDHYWPVLIPGWTLNYEMAFYLLFALSLFLPARQRITSIVLALGAWVVLMQWLPHPEGVIDFYSNPIILNFAAGMLLGRAYLGGWLSSKPHIGFYLIIFGIICWWMADRLDLGNRLIGAGIPSTAIVAGVCLVGTQLPHWPVLQKLGDASYSIYLSHVFTLGALRWLWPKWVPSSWQGWWASLMFMVVALALCAMAGVGVYRWIESPIAHRRRGESH